jgi:arylsulfatase A-like enzyme
MLGDHHAFRKVLPYEGSARVPLLLSGPEIPRHVVVGDAVVELRDVMPTLLDAAGLPVPDGLDGRSALPLARGERDGWREFLHGEHTAFGQSVHWLTDGRWKYVWWSGTGREQLFDLVADPQECRDQADSPEAARWRARLIATLADREEGFVAGGALVPGRPTRPTLNQKGSAANAGRQA